MFAQTICSQFHQQFMREFFVQIFCQSQNVTRKSCQNDVRTKNLYVKHWWNWHKLVTPLHKSLKRSVKRQRISFFYSLRSVKSRKTVWQSYKRLLKQIKIPRRFHYLNLYHYYYYYYRLKNWNHFPSFCYLKLNYFYRIASSFIPHESLFN